MRRGRRQSVGRVFRLPGKELCAAEWLRPWIPAEGPAPGPYQPEQTVLVIEYDGDEALIPHTPSAA